MRIHVKVWAEDMEVYGTDQGQAQVKQGVLGCPVSPREILSVHVWKTFPTALISPPHISSASPVSVLIGYKNQNSISSFLFLRPYSFALEKYVCFFLNPHLALFIYFFFLTLGVSSSFFLWIQRSSPSVATCVGHPLCPSIWPQWYEEARCS